MIFIYTRETLVGCKTFHHASKSLEKALFAKWLENSNPLFTPQKNLGLKNKEPRKHSLY